jgi:hypothetical protein
VKRGIVAFTVNNTTTTSVVLNISVVVAPAHHTTTATNHHTARITNNAAASACGDQLLVYGWPERPSDSTPIVTRHPSAPTVFGSLLAFLRFPFISALPFCPRQARAFLLGLSTTTQQLHLSYSQEASSWLLLITQEQQQITIQPE